MELILAANMAGTLLGYGSMACQNNPGFEDYARTIVTVLEETVANNGGNMENVFYAYDVAFTVAQSSFSNDPISCEDFIEKASQI